MKDFYTKEEMQSFTADQFLEFAELMYQGSDVDLNDIVSKFKQQFEGE